MTFYSPLLKHGNKWLCGGMVAINLLIAAPTFAAALIDIPVNTWVARELPGKGKAPVGNMKHIRLAHNPENGRIYLLGGDYSGTTDDFSSGRNELFSYSIAHDEWIREQEYCRADKKSQPSGPDQVGWAYDTKRKVFWLVPGYETGSSKNNCADSSAFFSSQVGAFNPATGDWDVATTRLTPPGGGNSIKKFAVYDPVTDSLIRFTKDGIGARVEVYNVEENTWTIKRFSGAMSNIRTGWDYTTIDLAARVIYMVDPGVDKLLRYDIDTQSISYISDLPNNVDAKNEGSYPFWDSTNQVLLLLPGGTSAASDFYVYTPATDTWQHRPITPPEELREGELVKGNNAVFDPVQNVVMLMGGREPANPYVFLYRYDTAGSNITIPSLPAGLGIDFP